MGGQSMDRSLHRCCRLCFDCHHGPQFQKSLFHLVAANQMKLVSGLVVAFLVGMFWKRATGEAESQQY